MSILGFLFLVFVIYLAYRVVFDFIIPIYRTTKKVKQGFRQMQERMNQQQQQYHQQQSSSEPTNNTKGGIGEYIEFEEVKD